MNIFEKTDYKEIIKARLREEKNLGKTITLQKIANQIPVQYTYLSKVLNSDTAHLSDDHLFHVIQLLKFDSVESDYLYALKDLAASQSEARKKFLTNKVDSIRKEKRLNIQLQNSTTQTIENEVRYLFDPYCILVYVALCSEGIASKAETIAAGIGISQKKYREILKILEQNEMISLGENQKVKAILKGNFHIGRNHPLMRFHQNSMKSTLQSKLLVTEEENKFSFMVTFSSDESGFKLIQDEFQVFLKKVEKICSRSNKPSFHRNLFQLNFDLLKWM